jgi:hypothetical protein
MIENSSCSQLDNCGVVRRRPTFPGLAGLKAGAALPPMPRHAGPGQTQCVCAGVAGSASTCCRGGGGCAAAQQSAVPCRRRSLARPTDEATSFPSICVLTPPPSLLGSRPLFLNQPNPSTPPPNTFACACDAHRPAAALGQLGALSPDYADPIRAAVTLDEVKAAARRFDPGSPLLKINPLTPSYSVSKAALIR